MLMNCIDWRGARVRRGCAGDAGGIVKQPQRGTRTSPLDPKGLVLKGLGRRPVPLAMPPASPRNTLPVQNLENAV